MTARPSEVDPRSDPEPGAADTIAAKLTDDVFYDACAHGYRDGYEDLKRKGLCDECLRAEIAKAIREAQVSAHLEDARAICGDCAGGTGAYYEAQPIKHPNEFRSEWHHPPSNRCKTEFPKAGEYRGPECLAPKVHDALSKLGEGERKPATPGKA